MHRGNRWARVVRVHPGGYSVDLLFLDDGARVPSVQVLSPSASTNTGINDLPEPVLPDPNNQYGLKESKDRDIYAKVSYIGGTPVVDGFLFPQVCQMLFADMNRRVNRHASDVYSTIDALGNAELYHPSGTYFRIATDPSHEDLTGKDQDQKWKIAKNTMAAVHVHLEVHNAGVLKASVDIDPTGNIVGSNVGDLTWNTTGNVDIEAVGTAKLKSGSTITLDAPDTHVTGTLHVDGASTVHGITSTGDIVADGISLEHHTHTDPQGGVTGAAQ